MRFERHIVVTAFVLAGCGSESGTGTFNDFELAAIVAKLGVLPETPPVSTSNRYAEHAGAAVLGKKLFFDTRYSGALTIGNDGSNGSVGAEGEKGKIGCVSCHLPDASFCDKRSNPNNVSLGVKWTTRNAPSLVNVAYYEWFGWGGKQDTLWTQASLSPESGSNSAGNRCGYAHMIWRYYRDEYDAIFSDAPLPASLDPTAPDAARFPTSCKPKKKSTDPDGAWETMTSEDRNAIDQIMANSGKATEAFERKLIRRNSRFDQFYQEIESGAKDSDSLGSSEKEGLKLFLGKAGCVDCHQGPNFTDNKFHNDAVSQDGAHLPTQDHGRYEDISEVKSHAFNCASRWSDEPNKNDCRVSTLADPTEDDEGRFRTKSLREVSDTGPYMHTGTFETIEAVIEHYNKGGEPADCTLTTPEGPISCYAGKIDEKIKPLGLSESEVLNLAAFLRSLEGEPLDPSLTEPPELPE